MFLANVIDEQDRVTQILIRTLSERREQHLQPVNDAAEPEHERVVGITEEPLEQASAIAARSIALD
jgi:hypothetical protein